MKTKVLSILFAVTLSLSFSTASFARTKTPQDILKAKYPNEVVDIVKTDDINYDKKKESFILTESGNFYLINSKGYVVLINTGINSDYFDELSIEIYSVTSKEKHVAIIGTYLPSNTELFAFRLKNGTLTKVLNLMGDIDVQIDKKGRVHQFWKKHKPEGGWNIAEGILTWNSKLNKYKGSGDYILK